MTTNHTDARQSTNIDPLLSINPVFVRPGEATEFDKFVMPDGPADIRLVWRPDAGVSIAFLVSGCVAFGVSAAGAYVLRSGSDLSRRRARVASR